MGKCYKDSPILEALCEFRFQPDSNWDYSIPGRFYEKVKAQFPERKQESLLAMEMEQHTDESFGSFAVWRHWAI